jgi:pimeloyl-ACP methyl ester carboxylesterase
LKPTGEQLTNRTVAPRSEPIAIALESGPTVRGLAWPGGPDRIILIHEVGGDLDSWGTLPATLATEGYRVVAIDLPGHGLSDDPWDIDHMADQIAEIVSAVRTDPGRCFVVAIGSLAPVIGDLVVDALVVVSPHAPAVPGQSVAASPCLIFVGGADPDASGAADRFFRARRGWAVVSSFGVAENGAALLVGPWAGHLAEQTIAFLRDYRSETSRRG